MGHGSLQYIEYAHIMATFLMLSRGAATQYQACAALNHFGSRQNPANLAVYHLTCSPTVGRL